MSHNATDPNTETKPYREGPVARAIEHRTARIPTDVWLWAAGGSIGLSLGLKLLGRGKDAMFVGQWVPTFLLLGIYNKIVKTHGSDEVEHQQMHERENRGGSYNPSTGAYSHVGD